MWLGGFLWVGWWDIVNIGYVAFLVARAALASLSSAGELARVLFLGGIVGLVFVAKMVCAKCWTY